VGARAARGVGAASLGPVAAAGLWARAARGQALPGPAACAGRKKGPGLPRPLLRAVQACGGQLLMITSPTTLLWPMPAIV
jgi:hypothetical protein